MIAIVSLTAMVLVAIVLVVIHARVMVFAVVLLLMLTHIPLVVLVRVVLRDVLISSHVRLLTVMTTPLIAQLNSLVALLPHKFPVLTKFRHFFTQNTSCMFFLSIINN